MEGAVIDLLAAQGVEGAPRAGAPGVYVGAAKIASLGLRIRHGCSYHGLAVNCAMDLSPFMRIDPCGFPGLPVTQLAELVSVVDIPVLGDVLAQALASRLGTTLDARRIEILPR